MIVAFSGGKDSTAMVLRLHELGRPFRMIYTPTGNELPDVARHIEAVSAIVRRKVTRISAPSLEQLIHEQQCLPNWRMRWCTRMIKIEPCRRWLDENPDTLAVGLRADEEGRAGATYSSANKIRYPLREWNWGLDEVLRCCERHGVTVPARTDCALCYYQTLHEWWLLWKHYPEHYACGELWEHKIGHTFRSPRRDTQPTSLALLRAKFEQGYVPKKRRRKIMCRVCAA